MHMHVFQLSGFALLALICMLDPHEFIFELPSTKQNTQVMSDITGVTAEYAIKLPEKSVPPHVAGICSRLSVLFENFIEKDREYYAVCAAPPHARLDCGAFSFY